MQPKFQIGDRVIWKSHDHYVVGMGPWRYRDVSEPWYSLRTTLAREIEMANQGFRRGFFDAWERELEPA